MSNVEEGRSPYCPDDFESALKQELEQVKLEGDLNNFHADLPGGRRRWVMDDPERRDLEEYKERIEGYEMIDALIVGLGFTIDEVKEMNIERTETQLKSLEGVTDEALLAHRVVKQAFLAKYELPIYEALRRKFPDKPGWQWCT